MDNIKQLKYELKLPGSLDYLNGSPLSSTKNVHRRVPVLVTRIAPRNVTISTTSLWSSSLPPSLDSNRGVDAWRCMSWLLSKLGVEYGEVNSALAVVWLHASGLYSTTTTNTGMNRLQKFLYKKENVFSWDNVKVKEQRIIIEHMITLKKNTLNYGYYLICVKLWHKELDLCFDLGSLFWTI